MKKIALLFVLIISINLSAQQIVEKIFSFEGGNSVSDLTKLEDGNLLMIANGKYYVFLSDIGDSISAATLYDNPVGVVQIDSFYFESGHAAMFGGTLTKRDQDFHFMLGHGFGEMGSVFATVGRVQKTISNNVILNIKKDWEGGTTDYRIGEYNTNLTTRWERSTQGQFYNYVEHSDESVLISSHTSDNKIRFWRIDYMGNIIYSNTFGSSTINSYIQTQSFEENAYLMCREDYTSLTENYLKLYKVDIESGLPLWTKSYFHGYNAKITSSCKGYENNMIVTGTCIKDNEGVAFIFTFNSNGDSISTMFIDSFNKLIPIKIISSEGYFYLVGNIYSGNWSKDIYFLKAPLDTTYITSIIAPLKKNSNFTVYPNPTKDVLWITTNSTNANERYIVATSIYGTHNCTVDLNSSIKNTQIDISNWSIGIYVLGLYENGVLLKTEKVVVLK